VDRGVVGRRRQRQGRDGAQGVEGDTQTSEAKQMLRRPRDSGEVEGEARARRRRAAFGAMGESESSQRAI
jgi:hypothetical protein